MVEVGTADAEAHRGLVRAEGHVPVEEGGQVPAAAEGSHLVRMDVGELRGPAKVGSGMPKASVNRSAATPAPIGPPAPRLRPPPPPATTVPARRPPTGRGSNR
ncbi:hypothetical protein AVW11_35325 [Streptomyces amritsarensis]|uniref:Uncharacterized protein n=1 Tax=Streptomyces amritsarensis TaxID=681158 RepID=A0ABX3FR47_9ACTN|nr:hypothetical protein [Streptomyces amritsarensis]OLZ43211.1 hypothetical protein AVW11_35325 [Streptomyces amritsarensis]